MFIWTIFLIISLFKKILCVINGDRQLKVQQVNENMYKRSKLFLKLYMLKNPTPVCMTYISFYFFQLLLFFNPFLISVCEKKYIFFLKGH